MKRILITIVALTSLLLTACGSGTDSKKRVDRNGRTTTNQQFNTNGGVSGSNYLACDGPSIYVQQGYETQYVMAFEDMLSAAEEPAYFGLSEMSGTCGSDTFVAFQGSIDTYEGFDPYGDNDSEIISDSAIWLEIIDESAVADANMKPIYVDANRGAYGDVIGDQLYAEFTWGLSDDADDAGVIVFVGTIDYQRQIVYGAVEYYNTKNNSRTGRLGQFEVPMCELFKCN